MAHKNKLAIDPVSTKDFSTITAAYSAMDDNTPLSHAPSLLLVQNLTDITLMFSTDGTNDHFPLASDSFILLDLDKFVTDKQISFASGTAFSVKQVGGTAATSGKVYITVFYPST